MGKFTFSTGGKIEPPPEPDLDPITFLYDVVNDPDHFIVKNIRTLRETRFSRALFQQLTEMDDQELQALLRMVFTMRERNKQDDRR